MGLDTPVAKNLCFLLSTHLSDLLDGAVLGPKRKLLDEHLEKCPSCAQKLSQLRVLSQTLQQQPRLQLFSTTPMKPLTFKEKARHFRSKLKGAPWYLRNGVEGAGTALVLVAALIFLPRVKSLYDRAQERRFQWFYQNELNTTLPSGPDTSTEIPEAPALSEEDFETDEVDTEAEPPTGKLGGAKTGQKEVIWRFAFKTSSPHLLRPKVLSLLGPLHAAFPKGKSEGISAPGGIQIECFLAPDQIATLKRQLEELASQQGAPKNTSGADSSDAEDNSALTWYRSYTKKSAPAGTQRVILWLTQI